MEAGERLLLPEIWLEVMKYLPVKDLCNMSLVSQQFNALCSRPSLWSSFNIKKIKFRNGDVDQYFKIRKFRKVKRLDFSRIPITLETTHQILMHSLFTDLCEIDLQGITISDLDPQLLSKSMQPLRKVDLSFTKMTPQQSEQLMNMLGKTCSTRMNEISLKAINLSTINAEVFASAIVKMEKVNLSLTDLTTNQLTTLLDKLVSQNEVNLKTIEFFSVDLSGTPSRLLGKALGHLVCVNISNTELRFEHIQSIFEEIMVSKTLKEINLDFSELFNVSNVRFAKSLTQLEKVSIACTATDNDQLRSLFELISKDSKIKELDLLDTDLSGMGAELMGSAVNNLVYANLSGSKLTGDQLNIMVPRFDFKVLKDLNLDYLDLCKVSVENICKLMKHLKKISLKKSNLTIEQINAVLTSLALDTDVALKEINFHSNNLKEVSSFYLAQAVTKVTSIDLSHTNIPTEMLTNLFAEIRMTKSSNLRNLVLAGNNMEDLDIAVVTGAISKLERLDLSSSNLSSSQLDTILDAVDHPLKEFNLFNIKMEHVDQNTLESAKDVAFINYRCESQ